MRKQNEIKGAGQTIFALASGQARAGVAVIRISGPASFNVLKKLTSKPISRARRAYLRTLSDEDGVKIDEALVLHFAGPASFTGEDMAELQTHGSLAVIERISDVLLSLGLRQAEPGEFTRRAFENGKMDLTEAEGLADLIDSETEGQRQQALKQMQGGLRNVYEGWREKILDALAFIEGEIDFPDEDGVPTNLAHRAVSGLQALARNIEHVLSDSGRGERVRHGVDIAIIGAPNAGKSSIINYLAKRDAAIVSSEPGTTRDIVEVHMTIAGLPVRFSDTAGLRKTNNEIEAEGVRRAGRRAKEADIRVAVIDCQDTGLHEDLLGRLRSGDFVLFNKSDLPTPRIVLNVSHETFYVSAITSDGFSEFQKALESSVSVRFSAAEQSGLTRSRHVNSVQKVLASVNKAITSLDLSPELAGADLREALHGIKELAGETDIEAVLDRVFSSFCIGK